MRMILFWAEFWILLLLPVGLVLLGRRATVLRAVRGLADSERELMHFARGFAGVSSVLPLVLLLLGSIPRSNSNFVIALTLYIPIVGSLGCLCALGLYLWNGRGVERWTGSLASILTVGWLVLLVLAGQAAA